jgi:transposase
MGIKPTTLHDWYKNHLSGFNTLKAQQDLHRYDMTIEPKKGSPPQIISVPIVKPENMGFSMALDEKYIAGEYYSLLTNNITGKVAIMAATHTKKELDTIISVLGDKRWDVRTLTRDLSQTYEWIGREHFMNAYHVADKFHVIRQLYESVQDVRVFYRQQLLSEKRKLQEQARNNPQVNQGKTKARDTLLENGETCAEILARSIHLLYKKRQGWSCSQTNRASVLFRLYPEIEKAYHLAISFREWYSKDNVYKGNWDDPKAGILHKRSVMQERLCKWYKEVEIANVPEMLNFKALVQRHQGVILNYFIKGETNAKAEALNRIIQKIITNNVNTRNIDFAHFRLKNFLS